MALGVDYSFDPPDLLKLKQLGYAFVIRYVGVGSKSLTAGQAKATRLADLNLVLVYEETARWMHGGWEAGVRAARAALDATSSCGVPLRMLYLADDESDGLSADEQRCLAGCAWVIGKNRTGLYSVGLSVAKAVGLGYAGWVAEWTSVRPDLGARLWQKEGNVEVAGGRVDINESLATDYGQCWFTNGGEDLTAAEAQQLQQVHSFALGIEEGYRGGDTPDYHKVGQALVHDIKTLLDEIAKIKAKVGA